MRFAVASLGLPLLALCLAACGEEPPDTGPTYRAECENLSPMDCLLPWPSSRYLVDDGTTATGRRIEIPEDAMPVNNRGIVADSDILSRFDGFSAATSIITAFANVDGAGLADEQHIDDSLAPGSPTVLLDAETGERVAHFAELDTWGYIDPARQPLYLRPATRLTERRRYLVAIRGLTHTDGTPVEPTAYFQALRDGTPLPEAPDLEGRRAHFEDIFTQLAAAGVERNTLIQAWDFETGSDEIAWRDTIAIRDEGIRRMAADTATPRCTVTGVEDAPTEDLWRRVEGTVRIPLFLEGTNAGSPAESLLHRAADGAPEFNGFTELPFVVSIPNSVHARVAAGGAPARLLDYGHGLFGDRFETHSGWFQHTIESTEMVGVAIDWWGWASDDRPRVVMTLQNFSDFDAFGERAQQGVANHVFLQRAFRSGGCSELAELQIPRTAGGTAPAIDGEQIYYYGNSQGGIFGMSVAGIALDSTRFVVGVGGMTYSIMIPRSSNWVTYGGIMATGYRDPLQRSMLMVLGQSLFDLAEPATYAPHVLRDPLPCAEDVCPPGEDTPLKHILSQIGRDDAQVPNISADLAARTAGYGYASPSPYTPWNVPELTAAMGESLGDSALVVFDIPGVPVLPLGTRNPMGDNDAHEGVRRSEAAIEQIDLFLRPDGTVVQTCDGVCDPT